MRDYPEGETRLGYGRIGDNLYNLDDEEERKNILKTIETEVYFQ